MLHSEHLVNSNDQRIANRNVFVCTWAINGVVVMHLCWLAFCAPENFEGKSKSLVHGHPICVFSYDERAVYHTLRRDFYYRFLWVLFLFPNFSDLSTTGLTKNAMNINCGSQTRLFHFLRRTFLFMFTRSLHARSH